MYTVVVSDGTDPDSTVREKILADAGSTIVSQLARTPEEVISVAEGADAILVDARTPVTADVVSALDSVRVVGRLGIGVDNIDVQAAADAGVVVVHAPSYCVDEVSTHAVTLLLACIRRLVAYDRSVRRGAWKDGVESPPRRVAGTTVGLVAFGQIGRAVAEKLEGFGVEVLAFDRYVEASAMAEYDVEAVDFEGLLRGSDAISIHAPLTAETRGLFDAEAFEHMRSEAVLVNTARGPIVDEDALLAALETGSIRGAGLDVFTDEPLESSPLFDRDDVIVTPHVAWYSEEARRDRSRIVTEDVVRVLEGKAPRNPVDPAAGF